LWRDVFSRLGNVATDASVKWSSGYNRLSGTPGPLYLFGMSRRPEVGSKSIQELPNNQTSMGFGWRTGARSRILLGFGASLQTAAEFSSDQQSRNAVETRQNTSKFPDVQVEYGRVPSLIRLDRILQNPQLRTSYNRSQTSDFNGLEKTASSTSSEWRPFIGLRGNLKNGTNAELTIERRNTTRELFQLGTSRALEQTTDINLSLNRSYSQGQRVSFLGKETTVKSSVNLGASAAYNRQSGKTIGDDGRDRFPNRTDRLSVNTTGSYGFSNNVTGRATLGFLQNRDLKLQSVRRSVRVELQASFTF
jgi:hypothetical protein